jgi:hypothetical protein
MTPPPIAVMIPSVSTPTVSSRATRIAVRAPFNANADVPVRSNASYSGDVISTTSCVPALGVAWPHAGRPWPRSSPTNGQAVAVDARPAPRSLGADIQEALTVGLRGPPGLVAGGNRADLRSSGRPSPARAAQAVCQGICHPSLVPCARTATRLRPDRVTDPAPPATDVMTGGASVNSAPNDYFSPPAAELHGPAFEGPAVGVLPGGKAATTMSSPRPHRT